MTALIASASGWNRSAVSGIPKIVHQTWKGCASSLPSKQARWREGCMRVNPGWSFWLWNDEDNRRLIADHYPSFLKMYDSYDVKMKRVDAARLFYLHRFGGIYMDLDFACLRSFEELPMPSHDAVFSHQYANTAAKDLAGVAGTIANNFMVAAPDHPFFAYAIRCRRPKLTAHCSSPRAQLFVSHHQRVPRRNPKAVGHDTSACDCLQNAQGLRHRLEGQEPMRVGNAGGG